MMSIKDENRPAIYEISKFLYLMFRALIYRLVSWALESLFVVVLINNVVVSIDNRNHFSSFGWI